MESVREGRTDGLFRPFCNSLLSGENLGKCGDRKIADPVGGKSAVKMREDVKDLVNCFERRLLHISPHFPVENSPVSSGVEFVQCLYGGALSLPKMWKGAYFPGLRAVLLILDSFTCPGCF